jgi:hypothetical protein
MARIESRDQFSKYEELVLLTQYHVGFANRANLHVFYPSDHGDEILHTHRFHWVFRRDVLHACCAEFVSQFWKC